MTLAQDPQAQDPQLTILSPEHYFEPEIYRREAEKIFGHAWIHVCHETRVPKTGDFFTCSIGDQSIIVIRGKDDALRGFYNVCRHRGRELLEGSGNAATIVCPYHGWSYQSDGVLRYARGSDLVPGFDKQKFCLSPVRVESVGGFVFVNLDPEAPSFGEIYGGFEEEIRRYEPRLDELTHVRSVTFDLAVNWKIAVENYLEAYHLVDVHPALRKSVDNDTWVMSLHDHHTSLIGVANPAVDAAYDFAEAEKLAQTNWWLWPMVMFEQMPGGNQVFTYNHIPLGPERTLQVVDFYFLNDRLSDAQRAEVDYVEKVVRLEDKVAIEGVQRGLHSRGYRNGPLVIGPDVPDEITEKGVLHFQQLVSSALAA